MGTFDGVHRGHRKLIMEVVRRARKNRTKSVVVTYERHPLETLNLVTYPYILTEKKEKERLIKQLEVDCIVYLKFDSEMATLSPDDFLKKVLIKYINPKEIVFGYDTHFGIGRSGDYNFLKLNEKKYSYKADIVSPFKINEEIVSSSKIRELIKSGYVKQAENLLGRSYTISGKVVHGASLGRRIGFPTINISQNIRYKLNPKTGVYVTRATINKKKYLSVTSIGKSPTLKDMLSNNVETHLLNVRANFYGKQVKLEFLEFIREVIKFGSANELIKAIEEDIVFARKNYE
jgi:riboflavin kinase/FMN adenylyltransferase